MEDLQALNNGADVVNAENIMDTVEELADLLMWLESEYSADSRKEEGKHNGKC